MAKKKHRRALLDVLSGEKDLARSLSDWSVSEHPAATGGTFVADTAKKAAQAAARPEPGVGVVRLTYAQTAVLVLLVLAMVLAAFFVGKRFGTIALPDTADTETSDEILRGPVETDLLPSVRDMTPTRVERDAGGSAPETVGPSGETVAPPVEAASVPQIVALGAVADGRYRLRIITLPVGGRCEKFRKFLAARGVGTVVRQLGHNVVVFTKARFASKTSPEAQGFRKKIVDIGPVYSREGGPTNLASCYFEEAREEQE